jgi:hypothetical protein
VFKWLFFTGLALAAAGLALAAAGHALAAAGLGIRIDGTFIIAAISVSISGHK